MEVYGMRSRGLRRAALLLAVLAAVAVATTAFASAGTGAVPKKKHVPLCKLGQVTLKSKPCLKNPAFAGRACDAYNAQVSAIAGAPAIAGQNRAGGGPAIACYFNVAGMTQTFSLHAFRKVPSHTQDVTAQSAYDFSWNEAVETAATNDADGGGCYHSPGNVPSTVWPMNPPQPLAGVGDKAFTWDQCTPRGDRDMTEVFVLKGTAMYWVSATHPATTTTLDQLVAFAKQLMKTYP
jgi:hypothetical protein